MTLSKAEPLAHRGNGVEAQQLDDIADCVGTVATSLKQSKQVIRATLSGSNCCSTLGIEVRSAAPILALCRALIAAGHDPQRPLEAFRGNTLAITVQKIGDGARFTVEDDRHGTPRVRRWRVRGYGTASLVAQIEAGQQGTGELPQRAVGAQP